MADIYESYADLLSHGFRENEHFTVEVIFRDSKYAIVAPHGGSIEAGTTEIAKAVAGASHTFYSFTGNMEWGNTVLHVTSDRFKEARVIIAAKRARTVVTIHGRDGDEEVAYIGGLDEELKLKLKAAFQAEGISTEDDTELKGERPENICNRGKSGKGVQLELARGLRSKLFQGLDKEGREHPIEEEFNKLVRAIKNALEE
ncbi:MAG TPA: poly-gamma-glutamate hydrolase family protein [Pyrinomonadaceae bacterium]|nr:poly-gamma-glutamate hydrolase family protein [Pyrinomonadaceae bacterium]